MASTDPTLITPLTSQRPVVVKTYQKRPTGPMFHSYDIKDPATGEIKKVAYITPAHGQKAKNQPLAQNYNITYVFQCAKCRKERGEPGVTLFLCGRCKNYYYCSKECQVVDWPIHKLKDCDKYVG